MTTDPTHGLSVQHADALWDAVAIPGPTEPTFPMQHERVCRAVAGIVDELTPAPADRTAVYREVADELESIDFHPNATLNARELCRLLAGRFRRKAAETAGPETQAEAHPSHHSWRVEMLDGGEWTADSRSFGARSLAVERYRSAVEKAPNWADGEPVQRRLVRETTTYTVDTAAAPAAVQTEEADIGEESSAD